MTRFQDLFVGLVAIALGCLLIGGAAVNSQMLMTLAKSRRLVERLGSGLTRWTLAAIGAACVAMGLLIASGWRLRW
jgi:hypothetical protein